ncbi:MAG TPA: peptide deformylase [bacterium]|jgi:peptide deformylase|nr:peptide deformylase [bacterium]
MPILPIRRYPDPVLRQKARPVDPNDPQLPALVADLFDSMYAAEGVGLAANQVGLPVRVAVIDTSAGQDPQARLVLINPEILSTGGELLEEDEGCLSFPGLRAKARRSERAIVRAQGLDGVPFELEAVGLLGKALQHEVDHLNGHLFIDHLPLGQQALISGKLKQMKREAVKA